MIIHKLYCIFELDTDQLPAQIESLFGYKNAKDFQSVGQGTVNATILFTADLKKKPQQFVLRLYGKYSEHTATEIKLQQLLYAEGVAVPEVRVTLKNQAIFELQNYRASLFSFIPGLNPNPADPDHLKRIAQAVVTLQKQLPKFSKLVKRHSWVEEKYAKLPQVLTELQDNLLKMSTVIDPKDFGCLQQTLRLAQDLPSARPPQHPTLIHGDIYAPNLLQHKKQLTFLDFEAHSLGHPDVDVMTTLAWNVLSLDLPAPMILQLTKQYLDAYRKAGGKLHDPEYCLDLLQLIPLLASIFNFYKALQYDFTVFKWFQPYQRSAEFARQHRRDLAKLLSV